MSDDAMKDAIGDLFMAIIGQAKKKEVGQSHITSDEQETVSKSLAVADEVNRKIDEINKMKTWIEESRIGLWDAVARRHGFKDNADAVDNGASFCLDWETKTITQYQNESPQQTKPDAPSTN